VLISASTACFPELSLTDAIDRLVDLEYSNVEIALHERLPQLKPSAVAADLERAVVACRDTHRLGVTAYDVEIEAAGEEYFEQFRACCRLAKATKVVTISVPSGELGTPFNEEVERLRKLVAIAALDGVRVGMRSQVGRLSEDPDTVTVLCNNVDGLGLTLDPSHYIYRPDGKPAKYEKLIKYVYHVHLRDTRKDQFQVRVGQGLIEYGKIISLLENVGYNRALSVYITPTEEVDHSGELRKLRLLLESLL
jgi:sugar phosphate isomerase/epimerase